MAVRWEEGEAGVAFGVGLKVTHPQPPSLKEGMTTPGENGPKNLIFIHASI